MIPTREEAEQILIWAEELNPGIWINHCKVAARAAETIAKNCGLDGNRAYVSGLLHDIGRYKGFRELYHVYAGYELMKNKGYDEIARVCITHSFPNTNIDEFFGNNDCSLEENDVMITFLSNITYDEYDKLIQLCDAICTVKGVSILEVRLLDVIRRHGIKENMLDKIEAFFDLKIYFDSLCSMNIYDLFYDEIREVRFS